MTLALLPRYRDNGAARLDAHSFDLKTSSMLRAYKKYAKEKGIRYKIHGCMSERHGQKAFEKRGKSKGLHSHFIIYSTAIVSTCEFFRYYWNGKRLNKQGIWVQSKRPMLGKHRADKNARVMAKDGTITNQGCIDYQPVDETKGGVPNLIHYIDVENYDWSRENRRRMYNLYSDLEMFSATFEDLYQETKENYPPVVLDLSPCDY